MSKTNTKHKAYEPLSHTCKIIRIKRGKTLEKKINILFGIIGGLLLIFLRLPVVTSTMGTMLGFVVIPVIGVLSFVGLVVTIYFTILLIIDALKTVHRK